MVNVRRPLASLSGTARYWMRMLTIGPPRIDQLKSFPYRNIKHKVPSKKWPKAKSFNSAELPRKLKRSLVGYDTVAFIILRNRKLWFERYWKGYSPRRNSNSFSAAKSVVGLLIGIAQDKGMLNIDQPVADYLPSFDTDEKRGISIRHVLCMASGINFDENYESRLGPTAKAYYGEDLRDQIDNVVVQYPPGERFYYSSADTQILCHVLIEASGMSLSEFAEQYLWRKIGTVRDAQWSLDHEDGVEKAYCCLYSNARDFARIVDLMMHDGVYNGEQVISAEYVRASITPHGIPLEIGGPTSDCYGYQWWMTTRKGHRVFYARGMQGQYLIGIPDLDAIVVRLGNNRSAVEINEHSVDFLQIIDGVVEMIKRG